MAAVPSQPTAPSGGWNEGNPRAEGSGRPPASLRSGTASGIAAFPGCSLAPQQPPPGGGRRGSLRSLACLRASPSPQQPPPARPASLEGSASRGEWVGRRRTEGERHRDEGCSARRFLRSERCLTVRPSMSAVKPEVCIVTPVIRTGKRPGQVTDLRLRTSKRRGGNGIGNSSAQYSEGAWIAEGWRISKLFL